MNKETILNHSSLNGVNDLFSLLSTEEINSIASGKKSKFIKKFEYPYAKLPLVLPKDEGLSFESKSGYLLLGLGQETPATSVSEVCFVKRSFFEPKEIITTYPFTLKIDSNRVVFYFNLKETDPFFKLNGEERYSYLNSLIELRPSEFKVDLINLVDHYPKKEKWHEILKKSISLLKQPDNNLSKIVHARYRDYTYSGLLNDLFCHLKGLQGNVYSISYKSNETSFVSFTPESLFQLSQPTDAQEEVYQLKLEAIAGTRPRGKTEEEDSLNMKALLSSQKDISEHLFVVEQILEHAKAAMNDKCDLELGEMAILELKSLFHLRTPITITSKEAFTPETMLKLSQLMHPTPAVCGTPQREALNYLKEVEPYRNYYAGLFGVHCEGEWDFAVTIRSFDYSPKTKNVRVYAGAGIVATSNPEEEWNETAAKLASFFPFEGH